jgi:hypothetical protein
VRRAPKSILIEDLTRYTPDLLNGSKAQAWRDAVEQAGDRKPII